MSNTKDGIKINAQYKDRLFCFLFDKNENKHNILSLYNALNGTNYQNPNDLEITTIDDAIYIKMKNDVSFLIDHHLSLWEHQSTYNPNMPIRGLMYFGNLYDAHIEANDMSVYSSKKIKLPTPKYIVFYNGEKNAEPITKLKLSDLFIHKDESGEFEWTATMINLNKGNNSELLSKCKALADYTALVEKIREYQKSGIPIETAVDKAIDDCIDANILRDFLVKHRAEVLSMCITEFNEKVFVDGIRKDVVFETLMTLVKDGVLAIEEAAKRVEMSVDEFSAQMNQE